MMKTQKANMALTLTGALITALLVSASALADHRGGMRMHGNGEMMLQRMAKHLDMDEYQKEQAKAVYDEIHPQIRTLRQESREVRKSMAEATKSGASKAEIDEFATRQGEIHGQVISLRADMKRRVDALLTDEQRAKVKEMHERRKMRGERRRGRGDHRQRNDGPENTEAA